MKTKANINLKNYFSNVWSSLSQTINAFFGGVPCETIASRAYRSNGWSKTVINFVFFFEDNYCLKSFLNSVEDARWLVSKARKETFQPDELNKLMHYTDTPEIQDRKWFWSQPFEDQLKYVESGEWIRNGLSDFFALQWDEAVPEETRRKIAKAYAHRYGMPYNDPTVKNRVPKGHGMAEDGSQK